MNFQNFQWKNKHKLWSKESQYHLEHQKDCRSLEQKPGNFVSKQNQEFKAS